MSNSRTAQANTDWIDSLLKIPYKSSDMAKPEPCLQLLKHTYETLEIKQSVVRSLLKIGEKSCKQGLGTHSDSHIFVYSPESIVGFTAEVGFDNNHATGG